MINTFCPLDLESKKRYVARTKYQNQCIFNNTISSLNLEEEKRLYPYYTDIIKKKLSKLKYKHKTKIKILDICGGAGFLSYHIYKIFGNENKYYLIDINKNEIHRAKLILDNKVKLQINDFFSYISKTKYDLIIGNSFLHHFPDVPFAMNRIYSLLNNQGYFINLHEPSEKAAFVESIGRDSILKYMMQIARKLGIRKGIYGPVGSDLWIFNFYDLKNLLEKAKFKEVVIYRSGFFRTILEILFKCSSRKNINEIIRILLNISYKIDSIILNNFKFPLFNSYFFIAKKRII